MRNAQLAPFAALILTLFTSPVWADCPLNSLSAGVLNGSFNLPAKNLSYSSSDIYGTGSATASYDVPAGYLSIFVTGSAQYSTSAGAVVEDRFQVVGLAPGTPVTLQALFSTNLAAGGDFVDTYAVVSATLRDTLGNMQSESVPPSASGAFVLSLPVSTAVGQSFRLHFELGGYNYGATGIANGTFSFTGIPAGAAIVSCQGYVSDKTVASRPTSWGRLKTLYR